MFDPDVPGEHHSDPSKGFVHWIAEVTITEGGQIDIGHQYQTYYPPTPPPGTGDHRYQFFLFKAAQGTLAGADGSRGFDICTFMEANNLEKPIASFQFLYGRK